MLKMGGIICDMCSILITREPMSAKRTVPFMRKAKSGRMLHFCSSACWQKDTPPEETSKYNEVKLFKKFD